MWIAVFQSFDHLLPIDIMKHILASLLALSVVASTTGCKLYQSTSKGIRETEAGYTRLFDGKTLNGWDGRKDLWAVREGTITGETVRENPLKGNTFLIWTNSVVDNFELRLQYRILGGNSGIQYRSKVVDPAGWVVGGYQADFEAGKTYSGILYEERGRGILAQRGQRTVIRDVDGQTKIDVVGKLDDSAVIQAAIHDAAWNDYTVIANGNHLMHFINGRMTVDVVDEQPSKAATSGVLALQIHAGPPMLVQFRDLRLKVLP